MRRSVPVFLLLTHGAYDFVLATEVFQHRSDIRLGHFDAHELDLVGAFSDFPHRHFLLPLEEVKHQ